MFAYSFSQLPSNHFICGHVSSIVPPLLFHNWSRYADSMRFKKKIKITPLILQLILYINPLHAGCYLKLYIFLDPEASRVAQIVLKFPFYGTTVTSPWARWRLNQLASRLFAQPFDHAQIDEYTKAAGQWPLWGEFIGDRWNSRTKGQ